MPAFDPPSPHEDRSPWDIRETALVDLPATLREPVDRYRRHMDALAASLRLAGLDEATVSARIDHLYDTHRSGVRPALSGEEAFEP